MGFARVTAVGYVGTQPELRQVGESQTPKANFRLALHGFAGGERRTDWQNVTVWGRQAEVCHRHLSIGHLVSVSGRLQSRSYEKDGHRHWINEIVAEQVDFHGPAPSRPRSSSWGNGRDVASDDRQTTEVDMIDDRESMPEPDCEGAREADREAMREGMREPLREVPRLPEIQLRSEREDVEVMAAQEPPF